MGVLTRHLDEVGESYLQHLRHALSFALTMLVGAVVCFMHALMPFLFERTGSRLIERLHDRMVVNRTKLTPSKIRAPWRATPSRGSETA